MKKKYNPFKMWGSYVGAFFGLMIPTNCRTLPGLQFPIQWTCNAVEFTYWIKIIILGFLIGWGIHSLVRYLR